jgi:hypothetical protein
MKTIETTATVAADGTLTARVPSDIPLGEYQVVLVIDETADEPLARTPKPPLKLKVFALESWPADSTFRREDIYGDDGR